MRKQQFRQVCRHVGQTLKRRRRELSLTQEDVADTLGIVARHYQKIESGEMNLTLKSLTQLANALKISVRELF